MQSINGPTAKPQNKTAKDRIKEMIRDCEDIEDSARLMKNKLIHQLGEMDLRPEVLALIERLQSEGEMT